MPILKWLREKIVGAADTIISLDELILLKEFSMFPESSLVVIGSLEPDTSIEHNEILDELIEDEVEKLSRRSKRWSPEMIRERLQLLKQEDQDRFKPQKVTEWFMLAMYYSWINHLEMAEYCLFEAQIEAGEIKLQ